MEIADRIEKRSCYGQFIICRVCGGYIGSHFEFGNIVCHLDIAAHISRPVSRQS